MFRNFFVLILALGLIGLMAGCSNDTTTGDGDDISADFGGFKPTDEAPAFGDEVIASEMTEDVEFDDPVLEETEVETAVNNVNANVYALRIVWGQMTYDSSVTDVTDWTGSLTVTRGVEVLRRVIRFESGQDYIVLRTDPKEIEWVSKTTVHHDGIFVNVIIPPANDANDTASVTVTFETEPFTVTYEVSELAALDTIYYLDDSNAVAFHGYKVNHMPCPKGFLAGRWGRDEEGNGIFYGKWMSFRCRLMGHLRGVWGQDSTGVDSNIFYGKYIDANGNFEGLLKGNYWPNRSNAAWHNNGGRFRGYYYDANGNIMGILKGHFREIAGNSGMGYFQGRWKQLCNVDLSVDDGMDD